MIRTRAWRESVRIASGGLSDSALDREVVTGTKWQGRATIDRLQLFERAATMLPSRGQRARRHHADVIALAEIRWPGTEAVFEHPLWKCWTTPPKSFSGVVAAVDEGLSHLGLARDREAIATLALGIAGRGGLGRAVSKFQESVVTRLAELPMLDQLFLATILFREADVLRIPSATFLMNLLSQKAYEFGDSESNDFEGGEVIETALLYSRREIRLDDANTIALSLDSLAPLVGEPDRALRY